MIVHDSRDVRFRNPGGALARKSKVALSILAEEACAATLRLWKDGRETKLPMECSGDGLFSCEAHLPDETGALWYFFILEFPDGGTAFYGNARDRLFGVGELYSYEPPSFQITLYDPAFSPPKWTRDALMLQIMVDRFHCAGAPDPHNLAEGAYYHPDWYDWPDLNLELDRQERSANDFFGGNLRGILEKLPYIESLGVTVLYLNPIFRSPSNHKYDTGDYLQIDPSFGTLADFEALCREAAARGIRVVLDGVFSHTGADSVYFNKYGHYGPGGAYRDRNSPYFDWYAFEKWPEKYECWWGFVTLPNVREMTPGFREFINGKGGVVETWLRRGAGGWRLDVADELPMEFIRELRAREKSVDPDRLLIGEVWEDPSNKVAYGEARCYCAGDTLDSVMNYPLRESIFDFLLGKIDAAQFVRRLEAMREVLPRDFFYSLMNLLGSHDKPRAINVLADCGNMQPERKYRYPLELTAEQYALGRRRLLAAWNLVCALPGMPSIYYGDEAGLTGMADPFCRKAYPWGREDKPLVEGFRAAAQMRRASPALRDGEMSLSAPDADVVLVTRALDEARISLLVNRADCDKVVRLGEKSLTVPAIGAVWA